MFLGAVLMSAGLAFVGSGKSGEQSYLARAAGGAMVGGLFTVILIAGVLSLTPGASALLGDDRKAQDESSMAYIQCQEFVKHRLKPPASASFPSQLSSDVNIARPHSSKQQYSVMSYFDMPNSVGDRLRSSFVCDVKKSGDGRWNLIALFVN